MNFMEAAQAMKEGRIVIVEDYLLWKFDKNLNCFCNRRKNIDTEWSVSSFTSLRFIGANWEVINEEYTLASEVQMLCETNHYPSHYFDLVLKKHRDLIIKDLADDLKIDSSVQQCVREPMYNWFLDIINKRFGDLE